MSSVDKATIEDSIRKILGAVGEDPERQGLRDTPARVGRSYEALTAGYRVDADELVRGALFDAEDCDEMVIVQDIELYSLCEHHLLPFYGRCHVGYLPNGKILGLSKVARVVDTFARRLQVQERLTTQIASCLERNLKPRGIAVVVDAVHLCMAMRGVQKQNSHAQTSAMLGAFRNDDACRGEFLRLIGQGRG